MQFLKFFILVGVFVAFNTLLPNPKASITKQFTILSKSINLCTLYENDIELVAFSLTSLMKPSELQKILENELLKRAKSAKQMEKAYLNICKLSMNEEFTNDAYLLNLICNQIVNNADKILEDFDEANMFFWKVYEHVLNVKDKVKKSKKDLIRFISEEGAYLSDNLFTYREKCFWLQDYLGICYPNPETQKRLLKERVYKTIVRDKVKYHRDELTTKVSAIKSLYQVMNGRDLISKIKSSKIDIYDEKMDKTDKSLIEEFKEIAVRLVWRRINSVIARYRKFMTLNQDSFGISQNAVPNYYANTTKCTNVNITKGIYLDLQSSFRRCAKKYFYCPCVLVNKGSVSFKCYNSPNDDSKKNVTFYSHKCQLQYYMSTKTSRNKNLNFETEYHSGKLPVLEGAIYPWMLGDGMDLVRLAKKYNQSRVNGH